jgi:hypothetical protein
MVTLALQCLLHTILVARLVYLPSHVVFHPKTPAQLHKKGVARRAPRGARTQVHPRGIYHATSRAQLKDTVMLYASARSHRTRSYRIV